MAQFTVNTSEHIAKLPEHGTPYSGFRKLGDHKRAYTVASLAMAGMLAWDEAEGIIKGFGLGSMERLSTMLGTSAFRHWTKTTGRVDAGRLTVSGQNEVTGSLLGKANLNTVSGLVTAYLHAFADGMLREPGTGNVIERYRADAKLAALPQAEVKPEAKAEAKPKAEAKAKPARKPKAEAKPKPARVMITPKPKA